MTTKPKKRPYDLSIYLNNEDIRKYLGSLHIMAQALVVNLSYSDRPTTWRVLRSIGDDGGREAIISNFLDSGMDVMRSTWKHSTSAAFPNMTLQAYESGQDVLLLMDTNSGVVDVSEEDESEGCDETVFDPCSEETDEFPGSTKIGVTPEGDPRDDLSKMEDDSRREHLAELSGVEIPADRHLGKIEPDPSSDTAVLANLVNEKLNGSRDPIVEKIWDEVSKLVCSDVDEVIHEGHLESPKEKPEELTATWGSVIEATIRSKIAKKGYTTRSEIDDIYPMSTDLVCRIVCRLLNEDKLIMTGTNGELSFPQDMKKSADGERVLPRRPDETYDEYKCRVFAEIKNREES